MLRSLHIRNLVTIDTLDLEPDPGMSALTGETGAGKSILLDALGMVLGDKADTSLIRHGMERAEITAEFETGSLPKVIAWLRHNELSDGDECLLRRVISSKGRSRAFINGTPVTLGTLEALGSRLVDIHGQHAHQSLMHRAHQRLLLDAYAGNRETTVELADTWRQWKSLNEQLDQLLQEQQERDSRIELLQFQAGELRQLELSHGEWSSLEQEQKRLSHAESLLGDSRQLISLLYDDNGARALLQRAVQLTESMSEMDSLPSDAINMLKSALIEMDESSSLLQQYADAIELDPQRLQEIEQRMSNLLQAARKLRVEPEQLPQKQQELEQQLHDLENSDVQLEQLRAEVETVEKRWHDVAASLSESRRKAATELSGQVTRTMQTLSMPDGSFNVQLHHIEDPLPREHGRENVEFRITTNPGQPPQPLSKIASGGELSRISLAIQVATIGLSDIPTLIFDEVDVGIGGGVAEIVGNLLRKLGDKRQVLCVTHQPQVAAQAHHHLRVEKESNKKGSLTTVVPLDEKRRVHEIARMLGGLELTEKTLDHAREMLFQEAGSGTTSG